METRTERELPHYIGSRFPDPEIHDGRIPPARGVKCVQIARANATDASLDDGTTNTYKHAPDIAWYAGRFYVQYLTNPCSEHTGAGLCVLASSADAVSWRQEDMQISFPHYRIPACELVDDRGEPHRFTGEEYAFMHQRMAFYYAKNADVMLVSAFLGYTAEPWKNPWDRNGIGRVVRRLYPDGTLGDIYFILPNDQAGWREELLGYPLFEQSPDTAFVAACRELLEDSLFLQQWAEENGDQDERIRLKHPEHGTYQAFWWYHLPDRNQIIGLWKHALAARSEDGGRSFTEPKRCPSLVMSGQKSLIRRTADGRYAMVYDPTLDTQHRYPLCVTTSQDGLAFDEMLLICGQVPPLRHGGFWKDYGLQYMRGILEDLPQPPDDSLYVVYSVNKEDIWCASIPTPIVGGIETSFCDDFAHRPQAAWEKTGIYAPRWARVTLAEYRGETALQMTDAEPYDTAQVTRVFAPQKKLRLHISLTPCQTDGSLYLELCTPNGIVAARVIFAENGRLYHRVTCNWDAGRYEEGKRCELVWELDCEEIQYTLTINGEPVTRPGSREADAQSTRFLFMTAVPELGYVRIRTGTANALHPTPDELPNEDPAFHLEHADQRTREKRYYLHCMAMEPLTEEGRRT